MTKEERIAAVGKYIDKYYVPGNDDINLNDKEVKNFFDKISDFLTGKKKHQVEEKTTYCEMQAPIINEDGYTERKLSKPLGSSIATTRKLDDLMSQMDETFSQKLLRMIDDRNMTESEAYKKAYVDRRHFSKIKNDKDYSPNKKTVLAFAVALELSIDETKDLLKSAGYALSKSSKFDIIIVYCLQNKIYDMFEINDVLYEYEQPLFE